VSGLGKRVGAALVAGALSLGAAFGAQGANVESRASASPGFAIDDYFRLRRVTELALSPDGRWLAYAVEGYSQDASARMRRVYVRSLERDGAESAPDAIQDGSSLSWIPGSHELAFIAT
jgi:hypothetical protein